ncbi:hypothetical protein VN12_23785 [Pirellula sp. SH-Sr6A]|nr:hypothetical protein VN12_23785 [Pirellula sp. SH-Sr6A]
MLESRCGVCRSFLDEEDLFCCNCGTENPSGLDGVGVGIAPKTAPSQEGVLRFQCSQCGASMSYDPSARQLRCPFCGSESMQSRPSARTLEPHVVVPFQIDASQVEGMIREWLGRGFWRPNDAAQAAVISKVTAVYVPFWVFSAEVETAWTADTSQVPAGARGNWRPVAGTSQRRYDSILVGASGILTPQEVQEIAPFDLSAGVRPDEIDLVHAIVEEFRVTKRDARAMARAAIDRIVAEEVRGRISGSTRNIHVNNRVQAMSSVPALLPVWIMAYQYKEKPYRVLVNGQTREVYGIAPFSNAKLALVIVLIFAAILLLIAVVALGSIASHHL